MQWVQLGRVYACPRCAGGHPGSTHLGLGSLRGYMQWGLGALGPSPSPRAAAGGGGKGRASMRAGPWHLALLPVATWAQGAPAGLCPAPPQLPHVCQKLLLPGAGTCTRGNASVGGTQRAVTPQRWLAASRRERHLARRAWLQEGGGGGWARKHLDFCRSRPHTQALIVQGGAGGCNGNRPALPATPHSMPRSCLAGAETGDVLFTSGFALSPEGLGEFVTHSGFLSVPSW